MILRPYQQDAVQKMLWDMQNSGNSVVCLPQGSGKSVIIAHFAHTLGKPILILQPSKELLEQNMAKLLQYVDPSEVGVYSASMDRKDINKFTFGTIQSVYKNPLAFLGFDVCIVDEGDLVPMKKLSGMYRKFFFKAQIKKVFGMTGTPYKGDTFYKEPAEGWTAWQKRSYKSYKNLEIATTTKMITRYKEKFWERMLVVLNTHELMAAGYLSPLKYVDMKGISHEELPLNKGKSEFDLEQFDELFKKKDIQVISSIRNLERTYKSILIFCASVEQANRYSKVVEGSRVISAKTPKKERAAVVKAFKEGKLQTLFNCIVLTVGFDHPGLDCIVLAKPTRSLRLHSQILGRGTRLSEGKKYCAVYDFVSNVKNMGKLEEIKVVKINGMWDVVSDVHKDGFHMKELMSFKLPHA